MKKAIKKIYTLFVEKRLTTVAGAWVYYFLMSVIPLAFLLGSAFSVFGINVLNDLVSTLPEEFRTAGQAIAQTAENVSKSATALFIITAVFSCTTLLNQMSKDGDFLYGVKSKSKRGILRRLWAIVALSALFSLFLFMAFIFAFRNTIFPQGKLGDAINLVLTILAFSLVIFFCYVIIIILYKYISPVNQRLSELFLGGLCSLFVIVLGTIGLSIYLRYFSTYNAVYGSLTAIVVFLLWAYIVMLGLVFGVIVNDLVYQQKVNAINLESKVKENKKLTKSLKTVPKNKRKNETGIVNG